MQNPISPPFRHDDLKQMLDSNKDHLKLEAMKRIIGMVAKVGQQNRLTLIAKNKPPISCWN